MPTPFAAVCDGRPAPGHDTHVDAGRGAKTSPMMWIVRLALRRPYTFVVFALLILILGVFSIESMPTDIFPNIDIPVVTVVWGYSGMSADQIANRIVTNSERSMTTTVNDIDHIESQSLVGIGIIKVFFHPNVNIGQAVGRDHRHQPSAGAYPAARHFSALHHPVQRFQRSGTATGALRAGIERAATVRPGRQHHPHATGHD